MTHLNNFEGKIINGYCLLVMKEMPSESVDSIVTDPPYELGFMNKKWDNTGIANNVEMWKEVFRVLKSGGHLLSFSSPRTYHRMACAIEDAGFEIRDQIMWVFGSGFPKSLNVGKAIDKLQGNKREWISKNPNKASEKAEKASAGKSQSGRTTHPDITKGNSEYEGWGTALKPAHEPIVVSYKPLQSKHFIAIILSEINKLWLNLNVLDVEKILNDHQAKLNEVVNSVQENARISVLENLDNVKFVIKHFTYQGQELTDQTKIKENSVLIDVKENGNQKTQMERIIHFGEAEDILIKLTDISMSVLKEDMLESTALLWKKVSEEILKEASKFTTKTGIKLITELKILLSCLLQNTLKDTGNFNPNHEPIVLARKPLSEKTIAENVLKHGTGGINIDESRVGYVSKEDKESAKWGSGKDNNFAMGQSGFKKLPNNTLASATGRFPSNLIHDGSEEVLVGFPNTKGSQTTKVGKVYGSANGRSYLEQKAHGVNINNSGSAARFFYCAKSSTSERNEGLEGLEAQKGVRSNAPRESEEVKTKLRYNFHPTVKPVVLMSYLIKLITPKKGIVLDPFSGSGSTLVAAKKSGFKFIGIEKEKEYCEISRKRLSSINPLF